jgi:hypothetical protein
VSSDRSAVCLYGTERNLLSVEKVGSAKFRITERVVFTRDEAIKRRIVKSESINFKGGYRISGVSEVQFLLRDVWKGRGEHLRIFIYREDTVHERIPDFLFVLSEDFTDFVVCSRDTRLAFGPRISASDRTGIIA